MKHLLFWVGFTVFNFILGFFFLVLTNNQASEADEVLGLMVIVDLCAISAYIGYFIGKYKYKNQQVHYHNHLQNQQPPQLNNQYYNPNQTPPRNYY